MYVRKRVFELLETAHPGDRLSRLVDASILALILLNIAALITETTAFGRRHADFFQMFEVVSLAIFTAEYALRIWSCVEAERYAAPVTGRIRFALTPQVLIDLIAVLPFYIDIGVDTRFVRILRLLKLARYVETLRLFQRVVVKKRSELMVTLGIIGILLVLTSCLIYLAEGEANPQQFGSIPDAMWWSIVTLTTVGYGDISPITATGKLLAGLVAILGIGMFALPTSILGAAFLEEMEKRTQKRSALPPRCPHCPHCRALGQEG